MHCTKLDQPDLDSPHQELSARGLRFVVVVTICWQIHFSCVSTYWGSNTNLDTLL